ncbi:ATP-binding protein [Bifidobacterium sp. SO4]|uniref:ATP-binding protein n=1 Tax=Bifidobacterium sp. SO4 TaxID=2809030 RepID=UPI001BDC12A3|nr:ATP-binding protein [Bifidobacterium sp. SO4]MBT1170653.1 sensor histidine kinase [Bifidobacterium sp. SO4]
MPLTLYDAFGFVTVLILTEAMLLPYGERRSMFAARAVSSVCLCLFATWLLFLAGFHSWWNLLRYGSLFIVTMIAIWWCLDMQWREILFYGIAAYAIQHCAVNISIIIGLAPTTLKPDYLIHLLMEMASAALLCLLFRAAIRGNKNQHMADKQLIILSAGILVVTLVISYIPALYISQNDIPAKLACSLYGIACTVLSLALLSGLLVQSKWRHDAETSRQIMAMNRHQYELSRSTIDMINIRSHDLRNQINALRRDGGLEDDALESMERTIARYDSIAKTGNHTLDVILTDKLLICNHERITLTYLVDGAAFNRIEALDLYSLYGNMLDNAIEAVRDLPEPRRSINLTASVHGQMLVIRCENYTDRIIGTDDDGLPRTTKSDSEAHGFGMRSMRMTTDKLHGHMTVKTDDGAFVVTVIIPMPEKSDG